MGTSLSGLTPATTFDGLLKVGDNDPLTADLKAISDGSGNDSAIQLSTGELKVLGQFNLDSDTSLTTMNLRGDSLVINQIYQANETTYNSIEMLNSAGIRLKNGTGTALLARGGNIGIGGITTTPTARLQVKGSGATSATTSLLVQNSAGADVLQTLDNGSVGVGGPANSSYRVTMTSGVLRLKDLLFGQADSAAINNTSLLTMKWNGSTGIGISSGGAIDAAARLHVKGSGNTSTTTSLLVQNSDGTQLFAVRDDGRLLFGTSSNLMYLDGSVLQTWQINNSYFSGQRVGIGVNASGSYRLHVKGSGNDNTTTSLLVQNSDGTEHLKVTDDGVTDVRSSLVVNHSSVSSRSLRLEWGSIFATDNASELNIGAVYSQATAPRIILGGKTRAGGADAVLVQTLNGMYIAPTVNTEDPSAQLQVKGSGNDATTTALLVQNSDATDLLKVSDDGATTIKSNGSFSFETVAGTKRIEVKANGEVTLKGGQLAAYSNYNSSNSSLIVGSFTSPTASLQVKGSGATSATTALLVENSAGTELLKVVDDGQLEIKSNSGRVSTTSGTSIFSYSSGGGGVLDVNPANGNSVKFRARGDNDTFLIQTNPAGDNVGIGASSPDSTAKLQVDSTTQGFLPPRMTDAERDAITNPAAGLMICDTSNNQMNYWNGSSWIAF